MGQVDVVHAIPGRLRLRIPELARDRRLADAIVSAAAAHDGVRSVRANRSAASLIVEYDPAILRRPSPRRLVERWRDTPAHADAPNTSDATEATSNGAPFAPSDGPDAAAHSSGDRARRT